MLGSPASIIVIPDRTENFVVQESFAKYRGSNFDKWLVGRVDEPMAGAGLMAQPLLRNSTNSEIISELGGNLKARIRLADIDYAKKHGALRKDKIYIGYVEDEIRFSADESFSYTNEKGKKCVLRAVRFHWSEDGWRAHVDRLY